MNSDAVNQLIQGIGVMAELWTITFRSFISQGFTVSDAMFHTKAFMSVIIENTMETNGGKK